MKFKSGDEPFHAGGTALGPTLLDYWRWSNSELLSNTWRGVLAEFLVASALELAGEPRFEWAACDLCTGEGVTIEVKSAAYVQAWHQDRPSDIRFDIAPRKEIWDPATNKTEILPEPRRIADVYVCCVLGRRDQTRIDPLDVDEWAFSVLGRRWLDRERSGQLTIGLKPLQSLMRRALPHEAAEARYGELRATIEQVGRGVNPGADPDRTG